MKCTACAPVSNSMLTICREVVPRTIESSITTIRLPSITSRKGVSFDLTPCLRMWGSGSMKVRWM